MIPLVMVGFNPTIFIPLAWVGRVKPDHDEVS